jgi:hypothetical protein
MMLFVLAVPAPGGAQPARLHEVKAWRGSFVASARATETLASAGYEGRNASSTTIAYNGVISVDFVLDEFEDEPAVWTGRVVSSNLDAAYRSVGEGLGKDGSIVTLDFGTSGPLETEADDRAKLVFHRERGWSFHIGNGRRRTELTHVVTLKRTGQKFTDRREVLAYGLRDTPTLPYPERRMVLFASGTSERMDNISNAASVPLVWDYAVYLEPTSLEELRLEIEEPTDYATWRPKTTPGADAGAPLKVTARLVTADGKTPQTKVESFEWRLERTSREPGVTMNYPLNASDNRLDLELTATGEMFVLKEENQVMERAVKSGFSDTVEVVPFDWGGWSTLQVTAILADGRRVTGKLKGKSEVGLRVPKRAFNSYIADGWKKEKGASGADIADDDNAPVGDGTKGDGLTLYEEYRGFYEAGEHIDGDPKTKDFFVRLKQAGLAISGVRLFQSITGLKVHYQFTGTEFPETRVINLNYDRGPHLIAQHGVIVQINPNQKGYAKTIGGPGNPKMISSIDLMADVAASDPNWIASTVAHELGHSVNLWHHGDSDQKVAWTAVKDEVFEVLPSGAISDPIFILNEQLDNLTPTVVLLAKAQPKQILVLEMGRDQGQHSGPDTCVMRYDCAETYVYRVSKEFRIWDFKEPIGGELCRGHAGSGVNARDRKEPQSRYGPVQAMRGDCVHQILVNDAVDAPSRHAAPPKP